MVKVGFFVTLEVQPGKTTELEARLKHALPVVEQEPGTTAWFAVRLGPTRYAVFDVFPDEQSRQIHLEAGRKGLGKIADLLVEPPSIIETEVIAAKLP